MNFVGLVFTTNTRRMAAGILNIHIGSLSITDLVLAATNLVGLNWSQDHVYKLGGRLGYVYITKRNCLDLGLA